MPNPITSIILTAVDKTKAAFASARSGIDSLGAASSSVSGLLRNLFAGVSVVYFVGKLKGVIDAMNEVAETASAAGTSVENFTALQYAGSQAGVKDMEKSLVALVDALDSAAEGTGPAAEAFAALQIDPTQFSDSADALVALADKFAALPDGVTKTNLAIDIFGKKVGPQMIPLLNEGSEGIARMRKEAEALGVVMSEDAADGADRFGDNLDRIKAHVRGFSQNVTEFILPSLNKYLEAMDDVLKNGSALDKIRFFTLGNINQDTLDRITSSTERLAQAQDDLNRATAAAKEIGWGDTAYITKQRALVKELEAQVAAETRAADAKAANAKKEEAAVQAAQKSAEVRKETAKALKESTTEQIKDADRLADALRSAFSDSIKAEQDYLRQAKKLRAEASGQKVGDDAESQALAALDATIAAMRLQREAGSANLESVQDQADALRQLADQLQDVQKAEEYRRQANLAEATALEKAAADERVRYEGLAAAQKASADESAKLKEQLDGIGNGATVDLKPGPGIEQTKQDLAEILRMLDLIGDKHLAVGTNISGTPGQMADALKTAALQYGRRR